MYIYIYQRYVYHIPLIACWTIANKNSFAIVNGGHAVWTSQVGCASQVSKVVNPSITGNDIPWYMQRIIYVSVYIYIIYIIFIYICIHSWGKQTTVHFWTWKSRIREVIRKEATCWLLRFWWAQQSLQRAEWSAKEAKIWREVAWTAAKGEKKAFCLPDRCECAETKISRTQSKL